MRVDTFFKTTEAAQAHVDANKLTGVVIVDYYCNYKEEFGYLIATPDEVEAIKSESDNNWRLANGPTRADYE